MAAAADRRKGPGLGEQMDDMKDGMLDKVTGFVDRSRTRRIIFFGIVVPALILLIGGMLTKFQLFQQGLGAILDNPSYQTMMWFLPAVGALGLSVSGLLGELFDSASEKARQRASKICAVAFPILYIGILAGLPAYFIDKGGIQFLGSNWALVYGVAVACLPAVIGSSIDILARAPKREAKLISMSDMALCIKDSKQARDYATRKFHQGMASGRIAADSRIFNRLH
ncbi:MAG: hypothetical protein ACKVOH_07025 [Chlamydiales bacterium]